MGFYPRGGGCGARGKQGKGVVYVRWVLWPFAWAYGAAVRLRALLYDRGVWRGRAAEVPTLCVGNLTVGGTGKTPMAIYCLQRLAECRRPAMLSRGYGRKTRGFCWVEEGSSPAQVGDEPLLVKQTLPDVPVAVCEDRVAGCGRILREHPEVDVIVLDDAYQHRWLRADVYLLLTDYQRPFTRDHFLPVGGLRDARAQRRRAHLVVATKCPPRLSAAEYAALRGELARAHQLFAASAVGYGAPRPLYGAEGVQPFDVSQPLFGVAGIARPEPFYAHLRRVAPLHGTLTLPDHAPFTARHLLAMRRAFGQGARIVTTAKDAVRLRAVLPPGDPLAGAVWFVPITIAWLHGGEATVNSLLNGIPTAN